MVAVSSPVALFSTTTHPELPAGSVGARLAAANEMMAENPSSKSTPCRSHLRGTMK
jgi:hypothetical protein